MLSATNYSRLCDRAPMTESNRWKKEENVRGRWKQSGRRVTENIALRLSEQQHGSASTVVLVLQYFVQLKLHCRFLTVSENNTNES